MVSPLQQQEGLAVDPEALESTDSKFFPSEPELDPQAETWPDNDPLSDFEQDTEAGGIRKGGDGLNDVSSGNEVVVVYDDPGGSMFSGG
jgi:hypothetical protein